MQAPAEPAHAKVTLAKIDVMAMTSEKNSQTYRPPAPPSTVVLRLHGVPLPTPPNFRRRHLLCAEALAGSLPSPLPVISTRPHLHLCGGGLACLDLTVRCLTDVIQVD